MPNICLLLCFMHVQVPDMRNGQNKGQNDNHEHESMKRFKKPSRDRIWILIELILSKLTYINPEMSRMILGFIFKKCHDGSLKIQKLHL